MSRGTRGGARGGGVSRGKHKIGGQEMTWDYDPDIDTPSEPQIMFATMGEDFPRAQSPSLREKHAVRFFKTIRDRLHRGPLHTVLNDKACVGKHRQSKKTSTFNLFTDMPRYSDKYQRPQQRLARFNTRTYPVKFFPEELVDVFGTTDGPGRKPKRYERRTNQSHDADEVEELEDADGPKDDDEKEASTRKPDDDEEPEEVEPDPDETFEDDEDEMAGDYNAEGYFSGGEGDDDDAAMGADDGGADLD